jgi:hypothetical protein
MEANVTLLQDLAIVCAVSGLCALIFHYLKAPLLLGYIVGGLLIGPHSFASCIHGAASIEQLSELGVIFLMFYIGLEFDLDKLRRIFAPSAFWLTLQTIGMSHPAKSEIFPKTKNVDTFANFTTRQKSLGWAQRYSVFTNGFAIASAAVWISERCRSTKNRCHFCLRLYRVPDYGPVRKISSIVRRPWLQRPDPV